ncbi:MAG: protein kinase, partial [Polyangiaceae bacterium]|nr:protein kinase [Polyangiaceae bacterium]
VYRAEHLVLKAPVAVKVIDRAVAEGDLALARFVREAQAAAALRSPHVVQIIDSGTDGGRPYMVMELLEGESLHDRLERLKTLTPGETYRVMSHVARVVAKATEAGIIHRDLKPDNIFLVHNGGDEIAKVLDFGVAKVESTQLESSGHTRTGSPLGTPFYMSPEQAQGNKKVDHRSDLWAVGVIAFECLTGTRPFESEGLGDLVLQICVREIPRPSDRAEVPEGFDSWFARAVARAPEERFQSARELSEELFGALGLQQSPGGVVRESKWSAMMTPGSELPRKQPLESEAPAAFEAPLPPGVLAGPHEGSRSVIDPSLAPTASDPADHDFAETAATSPNLEEKLPTRRESDSAFPSLGEHQAEGRTLGRSSRWQVVAEEEDRLAAGLPARSKGRGRVVLVALMALFLGGGGMVLAKQQGLLDLEKMLEGPSASALGSASSDPSILSESPATKSGNEENRKGRPGLGTTKLAPGGTKAKKSGKKETERTSKGESLKAGKVALAQNGAQNSGESPGSVGNLEDTAKTEVTDSEETQLDAIDAQGEAAQQEEQDVDSNGLTEPKETSGDLADQEKPEDENGSTQQDSASDASASDASATDDSNSGKTDSQEPATSEDSASTDAPVDEGAKGADDTATEDGPRPELPEQLLPSPPPPGD